MCRNPVAMLAAIALGVSVHPSVCERRIDGVLKQCEFFPVCGYEKQREATPDVCIIASTTLLYEKPDFMPEIDGLVADEKFHDNAIGEPQTVDVAALLTAKIEACNDEEHDFLTRLRRRLFDAVRSNGDGPLSRDVLYGHKIFPDGANRASDLEQRRVSAKLLQPDMRESELKTVTYRHVATNKLARDTGAIWDEIALFWCLDGADRGGKALAAA
jgi:hypothetical protein